jgi:hypothetical protein
MTRMIVWPVFIIIAAVGSAGTVLLNAGTPLRAAFCFSFLLLCPGMAWVRLLNLAESLTELTMGIALSIALGVIVSEIMVYSQIWSPRWGLLALIGLSLIGVALQMVQAYRRLPVGGTLDREGRPEA